MSGTFENGVHNLPLRVYYEDTDAGGIVFHANYLKFAERGRTEFLREIGFENQKLIDEQGVGFVVRHLEADYTAAGKLDDMLTMRTELVSVKNVSFVMKQTVLRGEDVLFTMDVVLVCVLLNTMKPVKCPDGLRDHLHSLTQKQS